jgi:hypothetical protein
VKKLIEVVLDYGDNNRDLKSLVIVDGNIPKSNHPFQISSQRRIDPAGTGEESEDVAGALWDARSFTPNQVMAHIQCSRTGSLDVEDGSILSGLTAGRGCWIRNILFAGTEDASFNRRRLVEKNIVSDGRYTASQSRQSDRRGPPALSGGDDLVLHDGRGRTEVNQIDIRANNFSDLAGQPEECQRIDTAIDEDGKVKVAL